MFQGLTSTQAHVLLQAVDDKLFALDSKRRKAEVMMNTSLTNEDSKKDLARYLEHSKPDLEALQEMRSELMRYIDLDMKRPIDTMKDPNNELGELR